MRTLYLFPDTNVFIQCHPLEALDWSAWKEFDEIHLIVCRPVQREIDHQKGRGSDRVGKRARSTISLFKEIIVSSEGYKLIREAQPQVKLLVEPSWLPSPGVKDRLDYSKADDEIVGCLYAFREARPDEDARLLTHDSGPMGSAKMLSLSFVPVPEQWLVQPESNEDERERRRLEAEVARLSKQGPHFHVSLVDNENRETDSLEFALNSYQPLTEAEIAELIEDLKARIPMATDFGGRERIDRSPVSPVPLPGMKVSFEPASDEEITKYRDEAYPDWLQRCENLLRDLHTAMQREAGPPTFCFTAVNDGTRPGKDVLITFSAKGQFGICPPDRNDSGEDVDDDDRQESAARTEIVLPLPPQPPKGTWTKSFGGSAMHQFSALDQIRALENRLNPLGQLHHWDLDRSLMLPNIPSVFQRDPNAFYYKPEPPKMPVPSFSLECDQWRHNLEPEHFLGEIYFPGDASEIRGALECQVHAENLPDPLRRTIPVRIDVALVSIRDKADELVANLVERTKTASRSE